MYTIDCISPDVLRQLLSYNPETGILTWNPRPEEMFKTKRAFGLWNTRFAGKEAFTSINNNGYYNGKVFGVGLLAHRVIWAMNHGWPEKLIDHIDCCRTNNVLSNLRETDNLGNAQNQGLKRANKSGLKGVDFDIRAGRYRAQISVNMKKIFLGYFDDKNDAYRAY